MSSDGSISSRISQFGLYRTIDARTEEFLKLSKKRQIKQGCVCAAISTALTVTVVVTVLLIYEYNVIAEARRSSHKANWLSLMNSSADDPNLLEILNKEKIEIDKTTLKLLPVLLKALNQNRYVEKLMEESTTIHTPYEKEDTTETSITKNIFADTRNWMKTPHSRLYTIEYKTSPIVYFKNPTRSIEYYTKIRKIRDYQRILNYVDKMISEKNYLGTTQPMKREYDQNEKPYKMTTPSRKHKPTQKLVENQKNPLESIKKETKINCKCSHKLSEVMDKLLHSIQQLLSYFSGSNSKRTFGCIENNPIQTKSLKSINEKTTKKNIHKMITKNYDIIEPKLTLTPPYKAFLNRHKYSIDTPTKSFDMRRGYTVNAIMNFIKPSFIKHKDVDINFESNEGFSTTNSYVKFSDTDDILKEFSHKSYINHLDNTNEKATTDKVTTVADFILQKGTYDVSPDIVSPDMISPEMRSSLSTFPETDFSDEDDYPETTERTTVFSHHLNRLDNYNVKLSKNNMISGTKNDSRNDTYPFKGARNNIKLYDNQNSMRKMGNLVSKDKESSRFKLNLHRFAPTTKQTSKIPPIQSKSRSNYIINITSTIKPIEKGITVKNRTKTKITKPKGTNPKQNVINNSTLHEKTEKLWDENISKETTLKHIEEAILILNNETTTNHVENRNKLSADAAPTYQWKLIGLEENATPKKSMIPLGRSTYLEMQRNDWKHDDFDNDMNYIFD